MKDFIMDLVGTFPELLAISDVKSIHDGEETSYQVMFDGILESFPRYMQDIMNENEEIFKTECFLLPGIDFKPLWNENITDKTKTIIWKYMKLLLFIVLGHMNMEGVSKVMEGVDIHKAVHDIKEVFEKETPEMKGHVDEIMKGRLGTLAKEIAEEAIGGDPASLQSMMSDPSKLYSLMNTVGDKLDQKIKSGDIKESELITEATELFGKMKDMPGMKQFESMFGKINMGATQNKMRESMRKATTRERLKEKLVKRGLKKNKNNIHVLDE